MDNKILFKKRLGNSILNWKVRNARDIKYITEKVADFSLVLFYFLFFSCAKKEIK